MPRPEEMLQMPTSRRVMVRRAGGPEVLEVVEVPVPVPARSQVRIRVAAAGVAFGDVMRRRGLLAPPWAFTPGYDVAGTVEAVGDRATGLAVGDRVAAIMPGPGFGGYADHVCLQPWRCATVPDEMPWPTAAALGLNYVTARQLLERVSGVKPGDSLLVHGAAGGMGTAVLELGQRMGLVLYGTASAAKHPTLAAYGCTAIDYRTQDFVEVVPPVDAVIDGIGGAHALRSHQVLKPGGVLVGMGVSGIVGEGLIGLFRGIVLFLRLRLRPRGRRTVLYGIGSSPGCRPAACRDDYQALLRMDLSPRIARVLPLDQVAEAHRLLDERAVVGKVVLSCLP
jgi:NADPH2:quinone reductase